MALYSAKIINAKARPDLELSSGQLVNNFHPEDSCFGDVCPVHKPSDHAMRDWPLAFTGAHLVRIIPGIEVSELQSVELSSLEDPVAVVIDPDDYYYLSTGKAIIRNSGICQACGDHIESRSRHDYKTCSCGKSSVDGGDAYLRSSGSVIDTSLIFFKPGGN